LKGIAMTSTKGSSKDIGEGESSATMMRPSKTVRAECTRRRATSGRLKVLTAMVTVRADSARSRVSTLGGKPVDPPDRDEGTRGGHAVGSPQRATAPPVHGPLDLLEPLGIHQPPLRCV
jgi:hypothetical protein